MEELQSLYTCVEPHKGRVLLARWSKKLRPQDIGSGPGLYDVINELTPIYHSLHVFSGNNSGLGVRDVSLEINEQSIQPEVLLSLDQTSSYEDAIKALKHEFTNAAQGRSRRRIALDILKSVKDILLKMDKGIARKFRQSAEFSPIRHIGTPIPQASKDRLERFNPKFVKTHLHDADIKRQAYGTFKIQTGNDQYFADVIINVTGHGRHNAPIIESLKTQGLVRVSDITNSLETDQDGFRVKPSGLSVIGPATHVGCDGIESFAIYAEKWAQSFIDNLERERRLDNSEDLRLYM